MSSLFFGRGWKTQLRSFSTRGLAALAAAVPPLGFVARVIGNSTTLAISIVPRPAVSVGELRTAPICRLLKEELTIDTVSEPPGTEDEITIPLDCLDRFAIQAGSILLWVGWLALINFYAAFPP